MDTTSLVKNTIYSGVQGLSGITSPIVPALSGHFLPNIKTGDLIFFSKVNNLTQLAINKLQQLFGLGSSHTWDVTHVGLVNEVHGNKINISEIAGYGHSLRTNEYSIEHLYNDEKFIVASLNHNSPNFINLLKKTSDIWTNHNIQELSQEINLYNIQGFLKVPFKGKIDNIDKINMINDIIDLVVLKRNPWEIKFNELKEKKFFCSELVTEIYQVSRLLETLDMPKEVFTLDIESVQGRLKAIDLLKTHLDNNKVWAQFSEDPLFMLSSQATSPASLLSLLQERHKTIVIENPEKKTRYPDPQRLSSEEQYKFIEYQSVKLLDRWMKGETLTENDPEVQQLMIWLENNFSYSKETLRCFLSINSSTENVANKLEQCLTETLTWQEKLTIFFFAREINRAVENLLRDPNFVNFLQNPTLDNFNKFDFEKWELSMEAIFNKSFPVSFSQPVSSMENWVIKQYRENLDKKSLFKYIPLSLAYSPPTETVRQFLEEQNFDLLKLTQRIRTFYIFINIGRGKEGEINNGAALLNALAYSGLLNKETFWMKKAIEKMHQETDYSKETLNCIVDKVAQQALNPANVESCLQNTLVVSEKLHIFLTSQLIQTAVANALKNEHFLHFVRTGNMDKEWRDIQTMDPIIRQQKLLELFYPLANVSYTTKIYHLAARNWLLPYLSSGWKQFIFKNVPLGLGYQSPAREIMKFIEEENLSTFDLVLLIKQFADAMLEKE